MIFIISLILLCISGYIWYNAYCISKNTKTINEEVEKENEKIEQEHTVLLQYKNEIEDKILEYLTRDDKSIHIKIKNDKILFINSLSRIDIKAFCLFLNHFNTKKSKNLLKIRTFLYINF